MKTVFFSLWIVVCMVVSLSAQNADTSEPRKARGRVAYFVSTSIPKGLENPVNVMLGKKILKVLFCSLKVETHKAITIDLFAGDQRTIFEIGNACAFKSAQIDA